LFTFPKIKEKGSHREHAKDWRGGGAKRWLKVKRCEAYIVNNKSPYKTGGQIGGKNQPDKSMQITTTTTHTHTIKYTRKLKSANPSIIFSLLGVIFSLF
jgi:hypothetical protein